MKFARCLPVLVAVTVLPAVADAQSANPDVNIPSTAPPTPTNPPVTLDPQVPPPQTATLEPQTPPPSTAFNSPSRDNDQGEEAVFAWNRPVFVAGAALFSASYIGSVVGAAVIDHTSASKLYIPVAGPWIALVNWGSCPATTFCSVNTGEKVLLVADGAIQLAGLVAMFDSVLTPQHRVFATTAVNDTKLHLTPTTNGMSVFSHF